MGIFWSIGKMMTNRFCLHYGHCMPVYGSGVSLVKLTIAQFIFTLTCKKFNCY